MVAAGMFARTVMSIRKNRWCVVTNLKSSRWSVLSRLSTVNGTPMLPAFAGPQAIKEDKPKVFGICTVVLYVGKTNELTPLLCALWVFELESAVALVTPIRAICTLCTERGAVGGQPDRHIVHACSQPASKCLDGRLHCSEDR